MTISFPRFLKHHKKLTQIFYPGGTFFSVFCLLSYVDNYGGREKYMSTLYFYMTGSWNFVTGAVIVPPKNGRNVHLIPRQIPFYWRKRRKKREERHNLDYFNDPPSVPSFLLDSLLLSAKKKEELHNQPWISNGYLLHDILYLFFFLSSAPSHFFKDIVYMFSLCCVLSAREKKGIFLFIVWLDAGDNRGTVGCMCVLIQMCVMWCVHIVVQKPVSIFSSFSSYFRRWRESHNFVLTCGT